MSVVVIQLAGGLGNQMFQYAAGRAVSLRRQVPLKLDLSGFAPNGKRQYALDVLAIAAEPGRAEELSALRGSARPEPKWWERLLGLRRPFSPPSPFIYDEPHFHFDPTLSTLAAPVYLRGYWQSEKYFQDCAPLLRRELSFRVPLVGDNLATAAAIESSNAVSLHVRRGDYVTDKTTHRFHGVCSLDYYQMAVERVGRQIANPHFFIFSDDPAWTRANLRLTHPTTWVTVNRPECGFYDMQLMSQCRHHIIANSTFSWWGAWLNPAPNKLVIAPQRWFGKASHNTIDLLPEEWIKL